MFAGDAIRLEISKNGHPCAWERGGGWSNTGDVTIIAAADGSPKKPIYIRRRGSLSNDQHALFIVHEGDIIIAAEHHKGDFYIKVCRIKRLSKRENEYIAFLDVTHRFHQGQWDVEPSGKLVDAVNAAMEKAQTYHCREPYYYRDFD